MTKEEIDKIKKAESKTDLLPLLHVWWNALDDNWRRAFIEETSLRELLNTLVCKHYMVWDPKPKKAWPKLSMEQLEKHIAKLVEYMGNHYQDKFLNQIIQFFTLPLSIKISGYYEESDED